ncbi:MerR family transcriptional regulator [Aureimonas jatrophae]|uniref:MerR HTH family regulatory protein n=1 Tax=Aureimonas jatrophae TaxID=1166073 RepID=A0A1H0GTV0_9HYPH|nr:MerR family transcriptional regulator [Aureimonas jatrophae]MBB3949775.1 DNA-binding transcriptional MerR regulator [Aureimonas jatrophae]SDO10222.1 MerR HTH family regulatory protein [Aureimonas jatrophae]
MATEKAADAFRTISEVAEELDLPQHVLRFWETRFPQIKPMKRGGGRRYYRPDDVELLRGVRYLLYVRGFTIRGVQRILKESGNKAVMAIGGGDLRSLDTLAVSQAVMSSNGTPQVDADHGVDGTGATSRAGLSNLLRRERGEFGRPGSNMDSGDAASLNSVILELLELKRLLDQVR